MTRPSKTSASLRSAGALLLALAWATVGTAQTRLTKPISLSPVVIVPPPTLTAESPMPTRILLTWPPVAGATGYRVTRADDSFAETTFSEGAAGTFAIDPGMCSGGMACQYLNTNVWGDYLYSYRVYSLFAGSPPIYSGPGPVTTAKPAPFVAPANLRSTVVPSTAFPGYLRATLTWDAVAGAVGYYAVADLTATRGFIYPVTVSTNSLVLDGRDGLQPRQRYTICVSTLYPFNIRKDSVRSCVTVGA
ncbi:MAG: hypothetical protein ACKVZ0_09600 [Gemmatimonadales bacterium]